MRLGSNNINKQRPAKRLQTNPLWFPLSSAASRICAFFSVDLHALLPGLSCPTQAGRSQSVALIGVPVQAWELDSDARQRWRVPVCPLLHLLKRQDQNILESIGLMSLEPPILRIIQDIVAASDGEKDSLG